MSPTGENAKTCNDMQKPALAPRTFSRFNPCKRAWFGLVVWRFGLIFAYKNQG